MDSYLPHLNWVGLYGSGFEQEIPHDSLFSMDLFSWKELTSHRQGRELAGQLLVSRSTSVRTRWPGPAATGQ
jgi:hypothetical protein